MTGPPPQAIAMVPFLHLFSGTPEKTTSSQMAAKLEQNPPFHAAHLTAAFLKRMVGEMEQLTGVRRFFFSGS